MVSNKAKKGNPFERDCEYSLTAKYIDIKRTHETGYILQYDLVSNNDKIVWECKFHRHITWNEAVKYLDKLKKIAPQGYQSVLLFKSNQQPCLVMTEHNTNNKVVMTFEDYYNLPFQKHLSTKQKKEKTAEEIFREEAKKVNFPEREVNHFVDIFLKNTPPPKKEVTQ
jgi:hypothetical protein